MIVSINQPAYLPGLSYFDRIARSDLHIVLDHVQFEKGSLVNRNRIRFTDGRTAFLTIPVEKRKPINETRIADRDWCRRHTKSIVQAYGVAASPLVAQLRHRRRLGTVIAETNAVLLEALGVDVDTYESSTLNPHGAKSDLVLNLCKEVGATVYLSGPNGRNYLNLPSFDKAGIEVRYHDYTYQEDPPLSAIDHLFNPRSREIWPSPTLDNSFPAREQAAV